MGPPCHFWTKSQRPNQVGFWNIAGQLLEQVSSKSAYPHFQPLEHFLTQWHLSLPHKHSKGRKVTCTCLPNLNGAIHCAYQWLVRVNEKSTLFPSYFVMNSSWKNTRDIFSFPVHMLVNSLSTLHIVSLDTVITVWELPDFWTNWKRMVHDMAFKRIWHA